MIDQTPPLETLAASTQAKPPRGGGRKRDTSRDAVILTATIDIMAEVGYDRLTVDMVAARAKSGKGAVYRRWPSKVEMVLDAVAQMKDGMVDLDDLPETGTLRGDLLGLYKQRSSAENERLLRAIAGLAAMLAQQPTIADAGHGAFIEPWVDANRALIARAVARGEVTSAADIEVVAHVIPSMAGYRSLIQRQPIDRSVIVALIDNVVLPTLGIPIEPSSSNKAFTGDPR